MTAPVDVLAVMDIAATAIENCGGDVAYLREASAAIAELIGAANACALSLTPADDSHNDGLYVVRARYVHELRAALARCGGAS